jgi:hypothetical protein
MASTCGLPPGRSTTTHCTPNSTMTWRQAPQGKAAEGPEDTATVRRRRCPSATARWIAARSAQTDRPYEAFSTLHAVTTAPDAVDTAAPTRNCEYGAYARRRAVRAARTSTRTWADDGGFIRTDWAGAAREVATSISQALQAWARPREPDTGAA